MFYNNTFYFGLHAVSLACNDHFNIFFQIKYKFRKNAWTFCRQDTLGGILLRVPLHDLVSQFNSLVYTTYFNVQFQ